MTVKELIEALQKVDQNKEAVLLDQRINPHCLYPLYDSSIRETNTEDYELCEGLVPGQVVIVTLTAYGNEK